MKFAHWFFLCGSVVLLMIALACLVTQQSWKPGPLGYLAGITMIAAPYALLMYTYRFENAARKSPIRRSITVCFLIWFVFVGCWVMEDPSRIRERLSGQAESLVALLDVGAICGGVASKFGDKIAKW